tara:strand:+ start:71 stop:448 length:378 start_codon:yes stop_codon:yes gene_type:complete
MERKNLIKIIFILICILQLFYIFYFRSGFSYDIIKNPFEKNTGISLAVSQEVLESKNIIDENNIVSFNYSDRIKKNTYLYQRIIEFNYPIRFNNKSNLFFYLKEENLPDKCTIIEQKKYLKFAKC